MFSLIRKDEGFFYKIILSGDDNCNQFRYYYNQIAILL